MFNVFFKTLRDKRFFVLAWALALALLGYSVAVVYPTFNDSLIDGLAGSMPPELQGFIGQLSDLKQVDTYLASQLFQSNLPIFISIFAVLLAVSLTVGEESKGQLRTLVALPVSRRKIATGKWLSIFALCIAVVTATTLGTILGLLQIGEPINAEALLGMSLMTLLLTVAMATIVFAVGLATGSRSATITIGVIIATGSYLLTTFAMGVEWLKDFAWLSLLHYFPAPEVARGTIEANNIFVYLGIILLALAAVYILFPRRDIKS